MIRLKSQIFMAAVAAAIIIVLPSLSAAQYSGSQQMHRDWSMERGQMRSDTMTGQTTVTGTVVNERNVWLRNTQQQNKMLTLDTQDRGRLSVDLGPVQNLRNLPLTPGTEVTAQGNLIWLGNTLVLMADQVTANQQTVQLQRSPLERQRMQQAMRGRQYQAGAQPGAQPGALPGQTVSLTGSVVNKTEVQVQGQDVMNQIIVLRTDSGRSVVVDLGSIPDLQGISVNQGDRITVTGQSVRIGNRTFFLASDVISPSQG